MRLAELGAGSPFGAHALPYGVFRRPGAPARVGVRLGDTVLDLPALARRGLLDAVPGAEALFAQPALNAFMARGRETWRAVRDALRALVAGADGAAHAAETLVAIGEVELLVRLTIAPRT